MGRSTLSAASTDSINGVQHCAQSVRILVWVADCTGAPILSEQVLVRGGMNRADYPKEDIGALFGGLAPGVYTISIGGNVPTDQVTIDAAAGQDWQVWLGGKGSGVGALGDDAFVHVELSTYFSIDPGTLTPLDGEWVGVYCKSGPNWLKFLQSTTVAGKTSFRIEASDCEDGGIDYYLFHRFTQSDLDGCAIQDNDLKERTYAKFCIRPREQKTLPLKVCADLDDVQLHLMMDYDRDGVLDEDIDEPPAKWSSGPEGRGAVATVCTATAQRAPLGFKACSKVVPSRPKTVAAQPWHVELTVSCPGFPDPAAAFYPPGSEKAAPSLRIDGLTPDTTLSMAALFFPGTKASDRSSVFDGNFTVTATFYKGTVQVSRDETQVRVAPFILANHCDEAEVVFVAKERNNDRFVKELQQQLTVWGIDVEVVAPLDLGEHESFCGDRWLQDCMVLGYTNAPNLSEKGAHTIFTTQRFKDTKHPLSYKGRDLKLSQYSKELSQKSSLVRSPKILAKDLVNFENIDDVGSSQNSGGNLQVTPPLKGHPWGRIYFGRGKSGADVSKHLLEVFARSVQAPFCFDVSWLTVGHVDEVVTMVPMPDGSCRVLVASPRLAYEILDSRIEKPGETTMLTARTLKAQCGVKESVEEKYLSCETTVKDFLEKGLPLTQQGALKDVDAGETRAFNLQLYKTSILPILEILGKELKIDEQNPPWQIIEVPVIFHKRSSGADALTADTVNMLVLNGRCLVPKPFGPMVDGVDLFEAEIVKALAPLGESNIVFIDDWVEYHLEMGEVHCGTNTLRSKSYAKWWES